ncbi:MAG: glycosyl hydrolase family 28-related protein, partial [Planctomycetota bacterium]
MSSLAKGIALTGAFVIWVTVPAVRARTADATNPRTLPILDWEPRSDWISVKAHGAAGDGKTDDTVAIQTALNAIKRGVTIYFPAGVYRVTRTLVVASPNEKALYGVLIIGHGRETHLVWDGSSGGTLIQAEGMGYSRWVGMELDGAAKAAVGQHHFSRHTFETAHRKRHMAFRGFTKAAVLAAPDDKFAMAETSFENCLFENCAIGVSFTQFNDYNITFDSCEFRACDRGILCIHGNFYARNCHFEGSRVTDIVARPEHGSSVRRCTSLGSKMFLEHANSVAGMTVEGCSVSGWKDPLGAVSVSGAPVMVFDCTFTDPPSTGTCAVRIRSHRQRLISSQNIAPDGLPLFNAEARKWADVRIHEIQAGERRGVALSARQQFLKSEARIPGKVFDAKRDFGAKGDGTTDDSAAIQKAIDAASTRGQGAIAYLPAGRYVVRKTLRATGGGYYVGGAGMLSTHLVWRGEPNGTTIAVDAPDHVTIEHLDLQKKTGIDILQTGNGQPSFAVYDGLFVSRYNDPPFAGGIHCRQLDEKATVLIPCVAGTLHVVGSSQATVLVPLSYYGSIIVRGEERRRDGILGVQSRFSGGSNNVVVEDSHSIVMSDYYSENSGN